jgi:hypothetical protein
MENQLKKKMWVWVIAMLSITSWLTAQNVNLNVDVLDGCGQPFAYNAVVGLYKIWNGDTTLVEEKTAAPYSFSNLEINTPYELRVKSTSEEKTHVGLLDLSAMRNTILGIDPIYAAKIFTGDIFVSGGVSTLDLVQMLRASIGLYTDIPDDWYFLEESKAFATGSVNPANVNRVSFKASANGNYYIGFRSYQIGQVAEAALTYCNRCDATQGSKTKIMVPNIDLVKGLEYEAKFNYRFKDGDLGVLWSLQYHNLLINEVVKGNGEINHQKSISKIYSVFSPNTIHFNGDVPLYTIRFTALENGQLLDFIEIDTSFHNEAFNYNNQCYKPYESIVLVEEEKCEIIWPPLEVTVHACYNGQETGRPQLTDDCPYVKFTFTDIVEHNIPGVCTKILRIWNASNSLTGKQEEYIQIIHIDENYPLVCVPEVTVEVPPQGILVYARDLVENALDHVYTFSLDKQDGWRTLVNEDPSEIYFTVFDQSDSSSCVSKVRKIYIDCDDEIHFKNYAELTAQQGVYSLAANLFDDGNDKHCAGKVDNFEIRALGTLDYATNLLLDFDVVKGKNLPFELRVSVGGQTTYLGVVSVKFLSNADIPPFQLTCYDDPVQKGKPFEIAIFSPNFNNVFGFQGAIKVRDAQLVKTRKVSLTAMDFNNEGFASRFIWIDPSATSQSYAVDDTLWTLTITPNRDGNVSDFIGIGDDVLLSEATLSDFNNTKIDLVFKFVKRVVAAVDEKLTIPLTMYPNPTGGSHVLLESEGNEIQSVIVYDLSGKVVSQITEVGNDRCSLATSEWYDGIYQIVVSTADGLVTRRLIVAR